MNTCETFRNAMTDVLVEDGELPEVIEHHLGTCDDCVREYALSQKIWNLLPEVDDESLTRLRTSASRPGWWQRHRQQLAAAVIAAIIFASGLAIGFNSASVDEPDVAELEEKVDSLNELVALSLLEQSSASARLEAVSRISEMENPSTGAVTGLLRAAVTDPNPNVRLAAVEAAAPLVDRPGVYDELAERLEIESSPLVQIALVDLLLEDPEAAPARIEKLLLRDDVEEEVIRFVRQRTGESI